MQQVLDELLDDRVGHLAALLAAVVVGLLRERGDERRQVARLHGDHARRAGEGVVDGDARRPGPYGHGRQLGLCAVAAGAAAAGATAGGAAGACAARSSASSLSRKVSIGATSIAEGSSVRRASRNALCSGNAAVIHRLFTICGEFSPGGPASPQNAAVVDRRVSGRLACASLGRCAPYHPWPLPEARSVMRSLPAAYACLQDFSRTCPATSAVKGVSHREPLIHGGL